MEVLFTFGTSRQFPYQRGYVIINAKSQEDAIAEFRLRYPNPVHPNLVNCAFWYSNASDIKRLKQFGNGGYGLHKYIDLMDTKRLSGLLYKREEGLDTTDVGFDEIVTAEYISPEEFIKHAGANDAQYYHFCKFLYDHVEVDDANNAVCDYTGFIVKYQNALRPFMKAHWRQQYPDMDDFCEAWIREFHGYLAGMTSEDNYSKLTSTLIASEQQRLRRLAALPNPRVSICFPSGLPIEEHLTKEEALAYLKQVADKKGNPRFKNAFSIYNETTGEFVQKGRYDWEKSPLQQNRNDVVR